MDNQHKKITGYRDLPQADIDLMNEVKEHEKKTLELVEKIRQIENDRPRKVMEVEGYDAAAAAGEAAQESGRWVSIAKTHLQQGYMALIRAVAKPKS
jgi:hypothetical protein